MNHPVKIKICGMKYPENIRETGLLNIDYMGFIFYEGSKRCVAELSASDIELPDRIQRVGVFVNASAVTIKNKIRTYGLHGVQLHGTESPQLCEEIKASGVLVIKAFGIENNFDWKILNKYTEVTDYFLFDTKSDQHGGTGKTFDWAILQNYNLQKPYFLSGGLGPDNINNALLTTDKRLYAIDLNSKFESEPGLKKTELLKQVVKTIKNEQISS
ncbi:phosphoribosylanthranilate isomerase [Sphingobacterium spiritivorum]